MCYAQLILMRHGESLYNKKNLFTGWTDIELSDRGKKEARAAGALLKHHGIYPDVCYTSWLKRAIHTANIVLEELEWEQIDMLRSYKLNERHYGAWQGEDKDAVKKEYGEEKFVSVRRGYDVAPPLLVEDDARLVWHEKKYSTITRNLLPRSESLKDTKERVVPYYEEHIKPALAKANTVLVSAHGNSLRALVMDLEQLSEQEVVNLEIPTGKIIVYTYDQAMNIVNKEVLI